MSDYTAIIFFKLFGTYRFGHTSVKISANTVLCFGGFGIDDNLHHRRLNNILLVKKIDKKWTLEKMRIEGDGPGNFYM